jgi:hypothetical protein
MRRMPLRGTAQRRVGPIRNMTTPQAKFERELEVFRTEAEAAMQFLYAFLTVHAVAGDNKPVYNQLNKAPLFWNTTLAALQTAAFIALGRVFDQDSKHNVARLLRAAQDDMNIFSKTALGSRKQGSDSTPPEWLAEYVRNAYVPTPADFRRLRAHVLKYRRIYEANYRDIRRRLFAHKEVSSPADIAALFSRTNIRELQKLLAFLGSLYEALWQLYFNGRKPVLRPRRYSLRNMRHSPSPAWKSRGVQERITHEVEQFLLSIADNAQPVA